MSKRTSISIILFLFALVFFSCSDDEMTDPDPDDIAFEGDFVSAVHPTSGVARINQARTVLSLTNFKTDSGPDLNMYLASDITDVTGDYIDLGDIKGVDGDYTYDLPENVDYTEYQYVVVWCVAFAVNFGYAELR